GVKENGGPIVAPFETCCAKYPLDGVYSCQGNAIWLPVVGSPHGTALCLGKNKSCPPATHGSGDHETKLALGSGMLLKVGESYSSILMYSLYVVVEQSGKDDGDVAHNGSSPIHGSSPN